MAPWIQPESRRPVPGFSDMPRQPKVAYVVKTFPSLSETFILNEILGVEALGLQVTVFSLRKLRPEAEPVHPDVAKVKGPVRYIPSLVQPLWPCGLLLLLFSHLALLFGTPRRYFETIRFHFGSGNNPRLKDFLQAGYLAVALSREKITHLHAHFANVPTTVAEIVKQLTGIPFSFTAHAKDIYLTDPAELKRKIAGATCVLTCTAYNRKHLTALLPDSTPIHLAYHGVDIARFASAGAAPALASAEPLILSVGRLCEKKGFPYLIRACRSLKDRGFRSRCKIVGSGELRDKLEALIAELDVADCVSLCGPMIQDDVIELYRSASVFVLPCLVTDNGDRDGIPNVLMEAMVSNLPVISTPISGITELVDHMVDGILVPERDASAIADAIGLLLFQPELGRNLAENGRAKVLDRFASEASTSRVHRLLLQTIVGRRRSVEPSETPSHAPADLSRPGTAELAADQEQEAHGYQD